MRVEPRERNLPILDGLLKYVPEPQVEEGNLQMQVTSLDYSSFLGRIAIGKVARGSIKEGQWIGLAQEGGQIVKGKVKELYVFEGLGKKKVSEVFAGDICAVVGFDKFQIGDTFVDLENPEPLERIAIDEPTLNMTFSINNSPFFGKDGKYVTSNHLKDRLEKELEKRGVVQGALFQQV